MNMETKDIKELKGIIRRQEQGYTATLYGNVSSAKYTKQIDDMYLKDLIEKYGLLQIVSDMFVYNVVNDLTDQHLPKEVIDETIKSYYH